jgi:type 1 glutamine amidotransferase
VANKKYAMKKSTLIKFISAIAGLAICLIIIGATHHDAKPKVLIFSKTNGFRHASIPVGITAIKKLGEENNFDVDATEDSAQFNSENLKKYKVLVFLSPTGKVFGVDEEKALQEYIHHGGGFVGIHAATDCEYNWQWYGDLVGGYFKAHPKQQQAKFMVVDKNNPATSFLPDVWERFDELYNFKYLNPQIHVLIKIDEKSYDPGPAAMGDNHPMCWCHEYEGGRAFYTELGHTDESYADPNYLKHILGGIQWAMAKKAL